METKMKKRTDWSALTAQSANEANENIQKKQSFVKDERLFELKMKKGDSVEAVIRLLPSPEDMQTFAKVIFKHNYYKVRETCLWSLVVKLTVLTVLFVTWNQNLILMQRAHQNSILNKDIWQMS